MLVVDGLIAAPSPHLIYMLVVDGLIAAPSHNLKIKYLKGLSSKFLIDSLFKEKVGCPIRKDTIGSFVKPSMNKISMFFRLFN